MQLNTGFGHSLVGNPINTSDGSQNKETSQQLDLTLLKNDTLGGQAQFKISSSIQKSKKMNQDDVQNILKNIKKFTIKTPKERIYKTISSGGFGNPISVENALLLIQNCDVKNEPECQKFLAKSFINGVFGDPLTDTVKNEFKKKN